MVVRRAAVVRQLTETRLEERLLIEWPKGEDEPTKYWLSMLPKQIARRDLVNLTKLCWRIVRDYLELKQEVGLGDFEGRGWHGFFHHSTLCIAAHGFLVSERETIPPVNLVSSLNSKNLPFLTVTDPEDLPLRTQRHVPDSIATMRTRLMVALTINLTRCPFCTVLKNRRLRPDIL